MRLISLRRSTSQEATVTRAAQPSEFLPGISFGDNEAETKMSMTAPVTSHAGGDE